MKRRYATLLLAATLATPYGAAGALAQSYYVETKVGDVQVNGNSPAAVSFTRADGSPFPNCVGSSTQMWVDNSFVTPEGGRSTLAVLMMAKATNRSVGVYYNVPDTYCRYVAVILK